MKVFVSCVVLVCCVGILNASSVQIENNEKKVDEVKVESDAKQDVKRSLSHGIVESSPITLSTSSDDGWAPNPSVLSGPPEPILPPQQVFQQGYPQPFGYGLPSGYPSGYPGSLRPSVVATNTDTLTTIRQNVPVAVPVDRPLPYPVLKHIHHDRPIPM